MTTGEALLRAILDDELILRRTSCVGTGLDRDRTGMSQLTVTTPNAVLDQFGSAEVSEVRSGRHEPRAVEAGCRRRQPTRIWQFSAGFGLQPSHALCSNPQTDAEPIIPTRARYPAPAAIASRFVFANVGPATAIPSSARRWPVRRGWRDGLSRARA